MRRCRWCGDSIDDRRADAEHCSDAHRIADWKERTGYSYGQRLSTRSERLPDLPGQILGARAVYALLKQRGDEGATTAELCQPGVGGCRFGARIHELREAGCEIPRVQLRLGRWRYWLTVDPFDVELPTTAEADAEPQMALEAA